MWSAAHKAKVESDYRQLTPSVEEVRINMDAIRLRSDGRPGPSRRYRAPSPTPQPQELVKRPSLLPLVEINTSTPPISENSPPLRSPHTCNIITPPSRSAAAASTPSWRLEYPPNWPEYLSISDLVAQLKQRGVPYTHVFSSNSNGGTIPPLSVAMEAAVGRDTGTGSDSNSDSYLQMTEIYHKSLVCVLLDHLDRVGAITDDHRRLTSHKKKRNGTAYECEPEIDSGHPAAAEVSVSEGSISVHSISWQDISTHVSVLFRSRFSTLTVLYVVSVLVISTVVQTFLEMAEAAGYDATGLL